MGQVESQWDRALAVEYRRTREQQANYQRLVNDYYNGYLDAYHYAMLYGTGTVRKPQETTQSENFDGEKLLAEEDF